MNAREYWNVLKASGRVMVECSPRIVWKFMFNFGYRNLINIHRFEKRQRQGKPFSPAFVMISVTESCNLTCGGCWVSQNGKQSLSLSQLNGIIESSKKKGSYFFGILGGEPLLYKGLLDVFDRHSDCYFQLFTNGMLITDDIAARLKKAGNVTPLISIEGLQDESTRRRGKDNVFEMSLKGLRACRKARLIIGVAASIGKSNYNDLVSREHIRLLAKEGVHYLWYYIYRPVGPKPGIENALSKEQILHLRRFIVEERKHAPLQIIDAYWDAQGNALCPAAIGMSHHISPAGAVEFCPPLQMAKEMINEDASNLAEIFEQSEFLAGLRKLTANTSRGCILLENPQVMVQYIEQQAAVDSTSRKTVMQEFNTMRPLPGHDLKGDESPERNVFYKLMKKKYFFGFGAYG